jgi:starch synthase/alpha-amylase
MSYPSTQARLLFVTPEATFIPLSSKNTSEFINAHTEGFAGHLAGLITALFYLGVDVHVAQPDYRKIFNVSSQNEQTNSDIKLPVDRVHLAEDRVFFYTNAIESNSEWENVKISLAFQREVINYIIPFVQPDIIHCHDWMTGLIPAVARRWGLPCIFTVHDTHTVKSPLSCIEDIGIDAASFWQHLFYDHYPFSYEESRETNSPDFLLSGIFASQCVNPDGPAILSTKGKDQNHYGEVLLRQVFVEKLNAGCMAVNSIHPVKVQQYLDLYGKMLQRPILNKNSEIFPRNGSFPDDSKNLNRAYEMEKKISDQISSAIIIR